jgi:hypothetical protein
MFLVQMNYSNILIKELLSEDNLNFLLENILSIFRIGSKGIPKCKIVVKNFLESYLGNISRFPENNQELIDAIDFLNKKCVDDFEKYLSKKYPNKNIWRNDKKQEIEVVTVITEEEKNELLRKYNMKTSPILPAPQLIQLFSILLNNKKQITIDEILTEEQAKALMNPKETNTIDLSNITIDKLPEIEKMLKEIIKKKNEFLQQNNKEMVEKLDSQKDEIINSIQNFKKKLEMQEKESEEKVKSLNVSIKSENNIDILDLNFDPSSDFNDLKNIEIEFKTDNRITDITLLSYSIPFNKNNVTRLNNRFTFYFNDQTTRIFIPPGKYEINTLLEYIKSQANFLDFHVSENNLITIKNNLGISFNLIIEENTIFNILGFTDQEINYREQSFYSASNQFNLNANEKVYFNISGSPYDPIEMEFDKSIVANKSLKKSNKGFLMKKMILEFRNSLNEYYDFISPFQMCFQITYME